MVEDRPPNRGYLRTGGALHDGFHPPWAKRQRCTVENVSEALDAPGEWYLNRATGVLCHYPLPCVLCSYTRIPFSDHETDVS